MRQAKVNQVYVLQSFVRQAKRLKISGLVEAAIEAVRMKPTAGKVIPKTGGLRKIRVSVPGRGKRGGARVLYCLKLIGNRAYLLGVLSKSEKSDFSDDFLKIASELAKQLE